MTEKDLKKLNRKQLLELLLDQIRRGDALESKLHETELKLLDRSLIQNEAGSIAEEAMRLNGVFEAAQAACNDYIENIKKLSDDQSALAAKQEEETRRRVEAMVAEAEQRCAEREAQAELKIKEASQQLEKLYVQKKLLDDIFKDFAEKHVNE